MYTSSILFNLQKPNNENDNDDKFFDDELETPEFDESHFDTMMAKNFDVNLDKIHEAPWQVVIQGQ